MAKKKNKDSGLTCNICNYPQHIEYEEVDHETGATKKTRHFVNCLGHEGIKPQLWNRHKDFDKFKNFQVRKQKESNNFAKEENND